MGRLQPFTMNKNEETILISKALFEDIKFLLNDMPRHKTRRPMPSGLKDSYELAAALKPLPKEKQN